MLYKQILTDAGYEIIEAGEGEGGIDAILDNKWDMVLLDIMLPKKDGLQVLRDLKEYEGWKKGPVVLLTNLNSEEIISNAFELGADGYLIKAEIQPDKLVEEVEAFFEKKPIAPQQ